MTWQESCNTLGFPQFCPSKFFFLERPLAEQAWRQAARLAGSANSGPITKNGSGGNALREYPPRSNAARMSDSAAGEAPVCSCFSRAATSSGDAMAALHQHLATSGRQSRQHARLCQAPTTDPFCLIQRAFTLWDSVALCRARSVVSGHSSHSVMKMHKGKGYEVSAEAATSASTMGTVAKMAAPHVTPLCHGAPLSSTQSISWMPSQVCSSLLLSATLSVHASLSSDLSSSITVRWHQWKPHHHLRKFQDCITHSFGPLSEG